MDETVAVLKVALVAALLAAVSCLPTLTALRYRHRWRQAIITLNLTLGWPLLGWAATRAWAMTRRWYDGRPG